MERLGSLADPNAGEGMARFGINPEKTLGVSIPNLRKLAKEAGKDHALAGELWESGIHEARILASMVEDPAQVTGAQADRWVRDFDSWDVCDQCCMNLLDRFPQAWEKAAEWTAREREYEKRAGFTMIACLAWHDKKAGDGAFVKLLPIIEREAGDGRNYVKKAVNWALRHIGKRNLNLNREAVLAAERILEQDAKSAKWIARDALRELTSEAVLERLRTREAGNR
jgi:3-methyladenine DNA glycosylase AlkD